MRRVAWTVGCAAKHTLPERVYRVDVVGTMVVVGLVRQLFHIYNVWQMHTVGHGASAAA